MNRLAAVSSRVAPIRKPDAVFFDFDGVIVDSVDIKTSAFESFYAEYGDEIVGKVREFHLAHGGVSRFAKFEYYESNILGKPADEGRIRELSQRFGELVEARVIAAPAIPGAIECLSGLHGSVPIFIVSGTWEPELRRILEARGLASLFAGVYGSPRSKMDILATIIQERGFDPAACVMVGDAMTDYEAASSLGLNFVGIVARGTPSPFPTGTLIRFDLVGLESLLLAHG
ncbi:MAG TPA: HAD-IA family hydrolase [Candidatus Competibacteraceae bacterium]|nr:HAD-IA family hydrolase [Candidatus Competibacteraceae bacterium]